MSWQEHPDEDVRAAIMGLTDALCNWERVTWCKSVLIVRDEGFTYRPVDGKPLRRIGQA